MALQVLTSVSVYLLWFEYKFVKGTIFRRTLFASTSYFVGCLLGGILLSKMSASRIKSSKGKVRNLRCVLISMFSIALFGSLLLIIIDYKSVSAGYIELIIFIVQLGISSSFVTINMAVLILIIHDHRVKMYAILQTINVLAIGFQPGISSYLGDGKGVPTFCLIGASSAGIVLSLVIMHVKPMKLPSEETVGSFSEESDSLYDATF